jgi:hypothetical protein
MATKVAEQREHPSMVFLLKFWGASVWMLELIIALSAVLGKYIALLHRYSFSKNVFCSTSYILAKCLCRSFTTVQLRYE